MIIHHVVRHNMSDFATFLQNVRKKGPHQRPQMRFTTSSAMIRISNTGMVHLPSMKMLFLRCRVVGNLLFFGNVCRQRCGDQAKRNPGQHFFTFLCFEFPLIKSNPFLSDRTQKNPILILQSRPEDITWSFSPRLSSPTATAQPRIVSIMVLSPVLLFPFHFRRFQRPIAPWFSPARSAG